MVAAATDLVAPRSGDWAWEVIDALGPERDTVADFIGDFKNKWVLPAGIPSTTKTHAIAARSQY